MTREEAINEIKSWAIPSKKGREVLETLIPEFRESEDERIRKELANFLRSPFIKENLTDEKVAPWIAYLERQKEPIDPFDTKLFQDGVKEGRRLEREDIKKEQKPLSTEETELNSIAFLEQMGYTCIPPRKEQPEVDLEKEYKTWWNSISGKINIEHMMEWYMHETARHFYELGLRARKEE